MLHALPRCEPFLVVINQQIVQQVEQLRADVARIDSRREFRPIATSTAPQTRDERFVHLQIVLLDVPVQLGGAQNVHDHTELVVIAVSTEEGKPIEDHSGHNAAEGPHIHRVVVVLQDEWKQRRYLVVEEQFGAFVVASTHTHIAGQL